MLNHPTLDKLDELKLTGMRKALEEQLAIPDCQALSFEERFALLVDREAAERHNRRLKLRLSKAKLRLNAATEDLDFRHPRGLDKALVLSLADCRWIANHDNCLITGPTGAGKTYLACALAHKACREGYSALYQRLPRLLQDLAIARGDGRYPKALNALARIELLVLDDWGTLGLADEQRRDLFEVLEDRYDRRSTLVASQLPLKHWHEALGEPTLADAILDRLVHNAHKLELKGDSMRKKRTPLKPKPNSGT